MIDTNVKINVHLSLYGGKIVILKVGYIRWTKRRLITKNG
jgi:hypothetical protein